MRARRVAHYNKRFYRHPDLGKGIPVAVFQGDELVVDMHAVQHHGHGKDKDNQGKGTHGISCENLRIMVWIVR